MAISGWARPPRSRARKRSVHGPISRRCCIVDPDWKMNAAGCLAEFIAPRSQAECLIAVRFQVPIDALFFVQGDTTMKRILLAAVIATFAAGSAFAQDACCVAKAVGKDGKPLAGAAKTSFMKKCTHDACEAKAVSADGKKLSGAAKTASIKKCEGG